MTSLQERRDQPPAHESGAAGYEYKVSFMSHQAQLRCWDFRATEYT